MSPGLVQDGTKCGTNQVCLSLECVPVSTITSNTCAAASNGFVCSGNGVSHVSPSAAMPSIEMNITVYIITILRFATTTEAVLVM